LREKRITSFLSRKTVFDFLKKCRIISFIFILFYLKIVKNEVFIGAISDK